MLNIKQNVLLLIRFSLSVFIATGLLFSSCSYKQNQLLFEHSNVIPDSIYQKIRANVSGYRIKPQDILQIRNMQESKNLVDLAAGNGTTGSPSTTSQLGETYDVDDDGTIPLTGIGRIKVAGLTRVEARKTIEDLYNKKYLKEALFDVKLLNLKVTVMGEVKNPGNYLLTKDNTKLIDVLGEAGGLTEKANEQTIQLIRGEQQNPDVTTINLRETRTLYDARTILRDNDVIYVAQNQPAIRTQKVQNFSVLAQPVLLLINTALIIFTLARR
ncbi:polysaccharide biosynthesis/export family protein [Mucilaginibacter calamicampi]|uniref:Polysaccharide biosynthesis/export family protein n=1 Tax=Mucilaginibacter calamicampi TaxID=1302352 RepID=A0ABW2YR63_9SPHI